MAQSFLCYFLRKTGICHKYIVFVWNNREEKCDVTLPCRVQRQSFLLLAIQASWSKHLQAKMSFQLAPKMFWWVELISQFFCKLNSSKYFTCPSGKLRREFTSPIAKSTSPGLSETTFFARCHASQISGSRKKISRFRFAKQQSRELWWCNHLPQW